jgi:predicted PurR-regulated permease PerM
MTESFNQKIKQICFLILLVLLTVLCISRLSVYLPGLLGAVALYMLSREKYFQFIYKRKWKRGRTASLFVMSFLIMTGLPVFFAVTLITPKINSFINNHAATISAVNDIIYAVQQKTGISITSEKSISTAVEKAMNMLPAFFNSTANLIANLAIMLFILYYMLVSCNALEQTLFKIIPLKDENTTLLAAQTKSTIKSNALGIPLIAVIQGAAATIGYLIFGVSNVALWGLLTGLFSFLPLVGSMVVWVPLCIYLFSTNQTGNAIGLLLYSIIVTSNIDYVARITIMKKLGDVHPVISLLGIILGLNLFSFIRLIFGPLLLNYIIVLFSIYRNEFFTEHEHIENLSG